MPINRTSIISTVQEKLKTELIALDSSRDNIVLTDQKKSRIVRISLNKSTNNVIEEARLISYLLSNGVLVPEVNNTGVITHNGVELPFIEMGYIDHTPTNAEVIAATSKIKQAAQQLALIHAVTKDFITKHQYAQPRTLTSDIEKLINSIKERPSQAQNKSEILEALEWSLDFYYTQEDVNENCIVHNDYRQQNTLFNAADELVAVIDFDWSVQSPSHYKDVAHAALEWSYMDGKEMDSERYWHFIRSYESTANLAKPINYKRIKEWARFSALADASYYFLSYPERTKEKFESYMYDKYKYLKDNEI